MTEIRFYHLERRGLEKALPGLLEQALAENARVVVQAQSREAIEALDEHLWTYSDESFLPHGLASAQDANAQPVVLADDDSNPNGATWRVLIGGARLAAAIGVGATRPPAVLILLFDGADAQELAAAREQWREIEVAGHKPSYWRQDDAGEWRPKR